jgi:hypothetical protein
MGFSAPCERTFDIPEGDILRKDLVVWIQVIVVQVIDVAKDVKQCHLKT